MNLNPEMLYREVEQLRRESARLQAWGVILSGTDQVGWMREQTGRVIPHRLIEWAVTCCKWLGTSSANDQG